MKFYVFLILFFVSSLSWGQNTPIIFVHGMLASGDTWTKTFQHFEKAGYSEDELHVLDWNSLDFNRENAVIALEKKVKKVLKNSKQKKVHLVGHSAGGGICTQYITDKKNKKRVAKYVHVASMPLSDYSNPVPTLNLYSTDDLITGGKDYKNVENKNIKGLDHYEIATSERSFKAIYTFFNEKAPAEFKTVESATISVSGKACVLGENTPEANALITVYAINQTTGERIEKSPLFEITSQEDGIWGPVELKTNTYYEFSITSSDENKRKVHYYRQPFTANDRLVYLRTLPASGFAGMLLSGITKNEASVSLALFSSSKAVLFERDTLTLQNTALATQEIAPKEKTPIAFFVYTENDSTSNGTVIPKFKSIPFMSGINFSILVDEPFIEARLNEQFFKLKPIASDDGIMVLVFD